MKSMMVRFFLFLFLVTGLEAETIDRLVIEGNQKVSQDTIKFYLKSREGSIYSEEILKEDFLTLWETGFFENIRIEGEDGASGKTVKVIVLENPLISVVTYDTGNKISQDDIVQKLQEKNIIILPFSYFNPAKFGRIQKIILEMLQEKGYGEGKVFVDKKEEKGQVALTIRVETGPKTRIGKIEFPGLDPRKVSPSFLRRGMKNNKVHSLFSNIGGKDVFKKDKFEEDLEGIRERLQQRGYLEAKVGTPTWIMVTKMSIWGKIQKMMKISIPIEMGTQYLVGNVNVQGNKVIRTNFLKSLITLKTGLVYNIKKRNKVIEEMQKIYGNLGYFYCQIIPTENLDPVKHTADLTINIQENDVVYMGKLEFTGNTFTKDHVIRREWFLKEGMRMSSQALEESIRRMKQLGLVTIEKMPDIKADPKDPQKLNVTAEVKELNRQMVNFNVGYSGYDGWFVAVGYSTQNFLGMGESLTLNLQSGTRAKNYQFAFTEPYLFSLPANFGIDVFKTSYDYPNLYTRNGAGFNLMAQGRFWKFWGGAFVYSYENIEITDLNPDYQFGNSYAMYYYSEGKRVVSAISPTISYSTVDSPLFPTSGVKYLLSYRLSGGFLGGDVDLHKYHLEFVKFLRVWKSQVLGFHIDYQFLKPFGGKEIPFYERYFLGGERSIRGFDIYTLGPKNKDGLVMGGDKAIFLNLEYQIPLNDQISFIAFYDIGNTYDVGFPISFKDIYSSTGLELKIFVPMLNVPFRLIFAYNPRLINPNDSHFVFRFAVGPSFY